MWIDRSLENQIRKACDSRPALLLTGARQTGKSSLLRHLYPDADYMTLDRVAIAEEAEMNPALFLNRFSGPVILDEIQYAPSLFRELKTRIDSNRQETGRWILTGSQRFELMKNVSESLAGRLRILPLETLSAQELRASGFFSSSSIKDILWKGGYPELWATDDLESGEFFEDYVQTYLERDLKELIQVSNLRDFRRLIQICATRVGQLLNYADLAKHVGVSSVTIKKWVGALETSGLIYLLPPFFANIGKRLVKAPKLYFADSGLLCHMLNLQGEAACLRSPMFGAIWENFVFSELIRTLPVKPGRNLFFYRDQNGVEMDFVIEMGGRLILVEAKAAQRVDPRKLNFSKIVPLFSDRDVQCLLMNSSAEQSPVCLKDYFSVNPLTNELGQIVGEG